jgi:hypothetical protein
MHSEDGDEDLQIASRYGIWPTIAGFLFGAGIIWFMFAFADGFA